jgi:hypothetical protein
MKKVLVSMLGLVVLSVAAIPAGAQTRARWNNQTVRRYEQRNYDRRYNDQRRVGTYNSNLVYDSRYRNNVYSDSGYSNYDYGYDNRSVWERSRDKITTAIGAGAGAAVGGLIGGKKGAIIGAIAGGGGAAIYTYGIRDKNPDRY